MFHNGVQFKMDAKNVYYDTMPNDMLEKQLYTTDIA